MVRNGHSAKIQSADLTTSTVPGMLQICDVTKKLKTLKNLIVFSVFYWKHAKDTLNH